MNLPEEEERYVRGRRGRKREEGGGPLNPSSSLLFLLFSLLSPLILLDDCVGSDATRDFGRGDTDTSKRLTLVSQIQDAI